MANQKRKHFHAGQADCFLSSQKCAFVAIGKAIGQLRSNVSQPLSFKPHYNLVPPQTTHKKGKKKKEKKKGGRKKNGKRRERKKTGDRANCTSNRSPAKAW